MSKGLLFVISGPSGTGKGCAVEKLLKDCPSLGVSVSATTRDPRPGEVDGVSYYFVSKAEFERKIADGEMLEYNKYVNGNYYGTPLSEVERIVGDGKDLILEIETNGASQVKKKWPEAVTIMITPPSIEELEERLRGRNTETEESIRVRLQRAKEELLLAPQYDYTVMNEDGKLDECVEKIIEIIASEHKKQNN